jgi:copper(I)-binding protein
MIENGWVRMAPGMPMGAAFAVLRNACKAPVEIVAASSPAFADVSLHETRVEGGISRMRAVPRITVRAGGSVELKPGGLHAMLMEPRGESAQSSRVRIDFVLSDGRRIGADLPVRAAAP